MKFLVDMPLSGATAIRRPLKHQISFIAEAARGTGDRKAGKPRAGELGSEVRAWLQDSHDLLLRRFWLRAEPVAIETTGSPLGPIKDK